MFYDPPPLLIRWMLVGIFAIIGKIIWSTFMKFKRVHIDERAVYVSNYLKEIRIELRDVAEVKGNWWGRTVMITFRNPTEFGSSIIFMPPFISFWGQNIRGVVEKIQDAVEHAKEN